MSCTTELEPDLCHIIMTNPDISGIGIRIAIYLQVILGMAVVSFLPYNENAFRYTCRNLNLVSATLIVTSLIQRARAVGSGPGLLDGIIVTMLTTISTSFVTTNGPYARTLGLSINISYLLFTSLWCYWGLLVWANPSSFSPPGISPSECPASVDVVFVLFGHNISTQDKRLRGFAIGYFSVGAFEVISALRQCINWSVWYAVGSARTAKSNAAMRYAKKLNRMRTQPNEEIKRITRFGGILSILYMIVTTEQIVRRNNPVSSGPSNWPLSQSLAILVVGHQLLACISHFKAEIEYRRRQRELRNGDM